MKLFEVPKNYTHRLDLIEFIRANRRPIAVESNKDARKDDAGDYEMQASMGLILSLVDTDWTVVAALEGDEILAMADFQILDPTGDPCMDIRAIVTSQRHPRADSLAEELLDELIAAAKKKRVRLIRTEAAVDHIDRHKLFESREFSQASINFERCLAAPDNEVSESMPKRRQSIFGSGRRFSIRDIWQRMRAGLDNRPPR